MSSTAPNSPGSQDSDARPSSSRSSTGGVRFAVGITPKKTATNQILKRQYVSPSTQSMSIVTDGVTPGTNVNLTPSSPNCAPNANAPGSYVCQVSLTVPNGNHVFTLTMYDGTNATGNVLSTNTTGTVTVTSSGTTVAIALEGVVTYASLSLAEPNPPVGTPTSIPLTVVLQDADKNMIVGPATFDNPVTLTTNDSKDGALSKTTLNSPADENELSVAYSGAAVSSITFSATATGLPSPNVHPAVLTPSKASPPSPSPTPSATASPPPLPATSTGALSTLQVGGTTYAFVPTSSISYPTTGSLIEVPVFNGGNVATSAKVHHHLTMVRVGGRDREANIHRAPLMARVHPDYVNAPVGGTSGIIACSPDQLHLRLYCIGTANNNITVVDGSKNPATVIASYATDAVNSLVFSGGSCYVCGVVYDPQDDAAIVGTSNGIEVYSSSGSHVSTTLANVSETFGYNPVTNQVFNPEYDGRTGLPTPSIDVIDIKTSTDYTLTPSPSGIYEPDQGAVDSATDIGLGFEEYNSQYYLVSIGSGSYSASSNSFTEANQVAFPFSSGIMNTCGLAADGIAIDSSIHAAFFNAEFCPGTVGAAQLPKAATAAPTISSFAFAPLPNTPDGNSFASGYDPHAQSVVFGSFGDYGLLFNSGETYLAVTDINKLLAAPRSSGDPTLIDSSYNLLSTKTVQYIPI